jgi:hypothetical protein
MTTSLSLSTDKQNYVPGELVTVTAVYDDGTSGAFTVTVSGTVTNPANPADKAQASTSYQVTPTAPPAMDVALADNAGSSYTPLSNAGGVATLTAPAPATAPPSVPSGFGGPEPTAAMVAGFTWMGFWWETMNWGTAGNAGPAPAAANLAVNAAGQLVLTFANGLGAEADSARGDKGITGNTSTWGYGTYTWVIGSDLSTLPQPIVLGLFTFWSTGKGGPGGQKEIDIEMGPMGIASAPSFCQLGFYQDTEAAITAGVPQFHTLVPGSQVAAKSSPQTTVQFTWLPDSITWNVWYGTDTTKTPDYTLTMTQGQAYTYVQPFGGNTFSGTVEIPATGNQQVIMNVWSATTPVYSGDFSVIIESFTYAQP